MKSFLNNFFIKPPVVFPLVACFLIFLTINEIQLFMFSDATDGIFRLRPLMMSLLTVTWIGATFFKKWGANGFLVLSLLALLVYYFIPDTIFKPIIGEVLMLHAPIMGNIIPIPFTALFSMIIMYHYKSMN